MYFCSDTIFCTYQHIWFMPTMYLVFHFFCYYISKVTGNNLDVYSHESHFPRLKPHQFNDVIDTLGIFPLLPKNLHGSHSVCRVIIKQVKHFQNAISKSLQSKTQNSSFPISQIWIVKADVKIKSCMFNIIS